MSSRFLHIKVSTSNSSFLRFSVIFFTTDILCIYHEMDNSYELNLEFLYVVCLKGTYCSTFRIYAYMYICIFMCMCLCARARVCVCVCVPSLACLENCLNEVMKIAAKSRGHI